jgi:hypothetical protein
MKYGWYPKQYEVPVRTPPKRMSPSVEGRRTAARTLMIKAIPPNNLRARRSPPLRDSSGEVAKTIHSFGIFAAKFVKFVRAGGWPNSRFSLAPPRS